MPTFTTSDGVAIRYEVMGDGPPVAVLQGGPNNICDSLIAELGPLTSSSTLIFHDYRGSGQSASAPPETYRFDRIADDLDELRSHLGLPSMAVFAHSMGGFIALEYALRHPTTCDRLALIGTTPCGKFGPMTLPTVRALGPLRTAKAAVLAASFLLRWSWRRDSPERTNAMYAPVSVTQESRRELRAMVASRRLPPVENDNSHHLMKALGSVDYRPSLHRVACPVLVLYGSRDSVMVAGGKLLARHLPQAEVHVLPRVAHEPFIEEPDRTFEIVRPFLAG